MKIALSGYYGFDNAGDEALLSAITSALKRLAPEAEFVVFSGAPDRTASLHGIRAVNYLNPFSILHELATADLLISGGGSIFQDVTSARSLPYYISVVALARLLMRPVIFYAQGVGPINRKFSKFLMRLVGNRVNLITLRDEDSREYMKNLGVVRPPLLVTADPVFSLVPDVQEEQMAGRIAANISNGKPLVGVSVRRWPALDGYQPRLARVLDKLSEQGYQILFIPMAYPDDISECNLVASLMQHDARVLEKYMTSSEHLAFISRLDLMIGMRLHALVFAASRGVPFAGISYDPKIDSFLKYFGQLPLTGSPEDMASTLERLLKDERIKDELRQKSQELRQMADKNAVLALSLVKMSSRTK
jgi:polysaccharide pyruvyl transferase CsaB